MRVGVRAPAWSIQESKFLPGRYTDSRSTEESGLAPEHSAGAHGPSPLREASLVHFCLPERGRIRLQHHRLRTVPIINICLSAFLLGVKMGG